MNCVVPLAGSDIFHPRLGIKALLNVNGRPLVEVALKGRPWWRSGELTSSRLIFVLRRDIDASAQVEAVLRERFAEARFAWLSGPTGGALFSALAAVSLVIDPNEPLCIDLADFSYSSETDPVDLFAKDQALAVIAPWFSSSGANLSYFKMDETGRVWEVAEKRVISRNASTGTYLFRDCATWLDAASWAVRHQREVTIRNALYICPSLTGVISSNRKVLGFEVHDVMSFSDMFHGPLE
jgi:hypothetical protein